MSKYSEWQEAKKNVAAAKSWLQNQSKVDSQNHKTYSLLVRLGKESFQFHGQEYAGANNYHAPESSFISALQIAIKKKNQELFKIALDQLIETEKLMAIAASDEVDEMLAEIKSAKEVNHASN